MRRVEDHRMVSIKDAVQELIGGFNLIHLPSARNDDAPCSEDAHGDPFALSFAIAGPLALTEVLALTDAVSCVKRIVVEFRIHALIDGFLQCAGEIVFIHQQFVESILVDKLVQRIVRIDELNGESLQTCLPFKGGDGEGQNRLKDPLQGPIGEFLGRYTCHLNASIRKQFYVHFFPSFTVCAFMDHATNHQRGLVEEGLGRDLSIGKDVLVTRAEHFVLVLKFQDSDVGIPHGNHDGGQLIKENIQMNGCSPVTRDHHGGDTKSRALIGTCLVLCHGRNGKEGALFLFPFRFKFLFIFSDELNELRMDLLLWGRIIHQ